MDVWYLPQEGSEIGLTLEGMSNYDFVHRYIHLCGRRSYVLGGLRVGRWCHLETLLVHSLLLLLVLLLLIPLSSNHIKISYFRIKVTMIVLRAATMIDMNSWNISSHNCRLCLCVCLSSQQGFYLRCLVYVFVFGFDTFIYLMLILKLIRSLLVHILLYLALWSTLGCMFVWKLLYK